MSSISISIIQADLSWEDKVSNLEMFAGKIDQLPPGTELVLLPEMFSTGFSMNVNHLWEYMNGSTLAWMKEIAASKKTALAGSAIIKENNRYYNRLIYMLPTGNCGIYDKRHLFSFGDEDKHYTAGNKRLIASLKGWKINFQICYDLRFPVWARQQIQINDHDKAAEYDILVYVANWPERRIHAWKSMLIARAIENQCYVVGVNRVGADGKGIEHNGNSMVIDPLGTVLYSCEGKEDIYNFTLNKKDLEEVREKFRFLKDADSFNIL